MHWLLLQSGPAQCPPVTIGTFVFVGRPPPGKVFVGVGEPGGTETLPPSGHHGSFAGHLGPVPLPGATVAEGATFSGPTSDSSLPLKAERAKA